MIECVHQLGPAGCWAVASAGSVTGPLLKGTRKTTFKIAATMIKETKSGDRRCDAVGVERHATFRGFSPRLRLYRGPQQGRVTR